MLQCTHQCVSFEDDDKTELVTVPTALQTPLMRGKWVGTRASHVSLGGREGGREFLTVGTGLTK